MPMLGGLPTCDHLWDKVQFLCRVIFIYFSPQKLASRSTLRHQGKGSVKDGNNVSENSASKLGIKDLTFLRVLGKGSFGKVSVICSSSGKYPAPYLRSSKVCGVISSWDVQIVQWTVLLFPCAMRLVGKRRERREEKEIWQQNEEWDITKKEEN